MHFAKTIHLLLILYLFSAPIFALNIQHSVTLRTGASIDSNIGLLSSSNRNVPYTQYAAGMSFGLLYDLYDLELPLGIAPELHYQHRFMPHPEHNTTLNWAELSTGLQLKASAWNLLYLGLGAGYTFNFAPKIDSSLAGYPYLVAEVGFNLPIHQYWAIHLALRGTTNIFSWQKPLKSDALQNAFSLGMYLGITYGTSIPL
jgi:hypothetical protein